MMGISKPGTATYSEQIARFVADVQYEQLTLDEVTKVKDCILDQLGVQLIASTLPWNRIVYDYARNTGAPGRCTVVGTPTHLSVLDAAFVNATFGHGCELDDSGHAGAAAVPTALALAEYTNANGRNIVTMIAVGYEIMFRLYDALIPHLLARGFHHQCVMGVFASAAIAGKLLGLSAEQLVHALGIAGSHASGTAEYDQSGGEVKRMHNGLGVRGGIQAAMLARCGLTGPRSVFEGKRGIFRTFVDAFHDENLVADLGRKFIFPSKIVYKLYPTPSILHTSIDAFGQLVDQYHLKSEDIKEIRVGIQEFAVTHGATIVVPHDVVSAQFCLAFSLAIRLIHGHNSLDLYLKEALWTDAEIVRTAYKVRAYADPAATGDYSFGSRVVVELTDGRTFEHYQAHRRGSRSNPVTREDLVKKFRSLASAVLDPCTIDQIERIVNGMEEVESAAPLMALMQCQNSKSA